MGKISLSIIIPAFNEEENIKNGALENVWKYLKKQKYSWELLIVDDASTDKTVKLAERFAKGKKNVRVLKEPHRGKGGTVIKGVREAKGDVVLFTDMDQATPINQLEKILPKFKEGFDVVIGSRSGRSGAPLSRKLMAYGFVALRMITLRLPFRDTQCGFKAFKRSSATKIFKRMKVFGRLDENPKASVTAGFDLEALYLARKLGYKVAEVPVIWNYKETERVSAVYDSIEAFRDMVKIRINAVLGRYL